MKASKSCKWATLAILILPGIFAPMTQNDARDLLRESLVSQCSVNGAKLDAEFDRTRISELCGQPGAGLAVKALKKFKAAVHRQGSYILNFDAETFSKLTPRRLIDHLDTKLVPLKLRL